MIKIINVVLGVGTCGLSTKRLTADSGVIISPGWPVRYPPRQDCYWKIELGQDKSVKIAFMDFDLEFESGCDRDKVKVKGDEPIVLYSSIHNLRDSDDDLRSRCRNVGQCHQQQSFSGLLSPGRSNHTKNILQATLNSVPSTGYIVQYVDHKHNTS